MSVGNSTSPLTAHEQRERQRGRRENRASNQKAVVQVAVVVVVVLYKRVRLKADVVALAQETHNKVNYNQLTGLVEP